MKVGRITARLVTSSLTRPSTAVGYPTCTPKASSTLPKECDRGSHRYCRSSMVMMPSASREAPWNTQLPWVSSTPLGRPVVPEV